MSAPVSGTPNVTSLVQAIEKQGNANGGVIKPAVAKKDALKYIVAYFGNADGRDKFNKMVQNMARVLMYMSMVKDAKSADTQKWKATFILFRDFRKLERLFKGLADIDKARELVASGKPQSYIQAIGRLGWCAYWSFDNASLAAQAKLIAPNDIYNRYSAMGWWLALSIALYTDTLALVNTYREEKAIIAERDSKTGADKITAIIEANKRSVSIGHKRREIITNYIKNGADWIVSAHGWQLPAKLGMTPLNDGIIGALGVISSGVVMAQVAASL